MLFRSKDGKLVEINRLESVNDKLYYTKILRSKSSFTKVNVSLDQIIKVCK